MKKKDSAVSSEGEIPVKSIAKAKQEKKDAWGVWRINSHPKASPILHLL